MPKRVLIFSEDACVQVVDSPEAAIVQCEGIDVLSQVHWFFDIEGQPLVPVLDDPKLGKRFLFWVVYSAPLPLVPNARRTAVVSAVIIAATVTLALNPSTRSLPDTLPPLWSGFFGLIVSVAFFLPLGAAAYVLRNAELLRGRDIQLGGVSAFFWFCYSILGWYALHRRVRIAAGVEAWTPGRGESIVHRHHIEHTREH